LGHAAGFVVAADEVHAFGVAQFEADEEGDGFDAEETAVDIVACGEGTNGSAHPSWEFVVA
jgi:hypothetical protein